jgi:cell division protein FtsB
MAADRNHRLLGQILALAAILTATGFVAADAVRGPHGLIASQNLHARISTLKKDLSALKAQRSRLERDAELLGPKAAIQPALVDEQARAILDLARPGDIVIVNGDKSLR